MARPKASTSIRDSAYNRNQIDLCRAKIETSKLIRLLQLNALGEIELDGCRQRSIEILLRKALPDLVSQELVVQSATPFALIPEQMQDVSAWQDQFTPKAKTEH